VKSEVAKQWIENSFDETGKYFIDLLKF